jgi:glycosyltransferase involved in cell wall biosynthesis
MKILHLDTGREMQGGQWQVLYLAEQLRKVARDYEGRLFADPHAPLFEKAEAFEIDVHPWTQLEENWRWADLVHAHDARAHSFGVWHNRLPRKPSAPLWFSTWLLRKPLVVSRRVGFPVQESLLSRWKYRQPQLYLAVSRYVAAELEKAGVPEKTIRVVYDGVPIPPKPSTLEPGRVVALAGKPIQLPGIPIHLTTDLWQDLSTASVFVYRSEMEGLGSAALAAMAAGVPVVASNVGGLPEAVEHESTGLLVSDGDFATPIRRLLANPAEAAEMGRCGRERVENNFTVDIMVEKTLAAYKEVLS